ncbi:SDR family NAD(P)-dependent oxidoreductase [Roseivirga sp. BDSF3-8]|uniref:SDR family NAD(P)-dependent oxidoreductase n=1 Tax=Roseivirga sp. BDSF3-8 TaxID=3241598 RepID=UPI0035318235
MKDWHKLGIALGGFLAGRAIAREILASKYSFHDKVVLVTGGSRGLGLVMARQLAEQGARIAICARDEEELEAAHHQLRAHGAWDVLTIQCDITRATDISNAVEKVSNYFHGLDVLINNAGQILVGPQENMSIKDYQELMKIHFYAPLRFMQAAIPLMEEQGEGRIINISSIGGKISFPHLLPYSTSKFALTALSEGMYTSLRKKNIIVTTACPGLMRTGSPRNSRVKGDYEKEYRWFKISDSLPVLSANAEKAAAKILKACRRGTPEIILTLPARLANFVYGISPSLMLRMFEYADSHMLPEGDGNSASSYGYETKYEKERTAWTRLTDEAARKNNEMEIARLHLPTNGNGNGNGEAH